MSNAPEILAEVLGGAPEDYSANRYDHPDLDELELVDEDE